MAMTARMRRLIHDYQQIEKDFKNHKNIIVAPLGIEPYEKYHVTYYVNGIYLDNTGRINTLNTHEVEITLHAEYPTYKPICRILTPIWHPNFRDGQVCIGDIWGAGESLTDIIINIGDMIQYKSWNSSSPLSADAARWALENKNLFPVGNINLNISEYVNGSSSANATAPSETSAPQPAAANPTPVSPAPSPVPTMQQVSPNNVGVAQQQAYSNNAGATQQQIFSNSAGAAPQQAYANNMGAVPMQKQTANDIEFTASDFIGVTYVPSAQRMQQMSQQIRSGQMGGGSINLGVVIQKGIIWGIIGGIVGFILSELVSGGGGDARSSFVANILGHPFLSRAYASGFTYETLADALKYDFFNNENMMLGAMSQVTRVSTGIWSAIIASMIGLSLGIGEGVYYGSKDNAVKYGMFGFGISLVIGFISGDVAQLLYSNLSSTTNDNIYMNAFVRAIGWSIMGVGIGAAIGLIKFEAKRFVYCLIGGGLGAFIGGFLFNFIAEIFKMGEQDTGTVARLVGIVLTGLLIGAGVGLLEQFAKSAWLKVVRGEFEGKEFLVFNGLTSVGGTGKNSIVLFKDKLVAPHHFDINMEGNKYVLIDCGSPMGTIVNGRRVDRYMLRDGDTISIGNTMLVFNSK